MLTNAKTQTQFTIVVRRVVKRPHCFGSINIVWILCWRITADAAMSAVIIALYDFIEFVNIVSVLSSATAPFLFIQITPNP